MSSLSTKTVSADRDPYSETGKVRYSHDLNGNITFLNGVGENLLGYSCDEACRLNISQIVAPEVARHAQYEIVRNITSLIGTVYPIEISTKAGGRLSVEVSMRLAWPPGRPVQIEGIAVPLSETAT